MSHWYSKQSPIGPNAWSAIRYIQKKKDGTPSKVIQRAKAFDDGAVESVTGILHRVGDPSGLIWWYVQSTIDSVMRAYKDGPPSPAEDKTLLETLREKADEDAESAAEKGKSIHACIEQHILTGILPVPELAVERVACTEVARFLSSLGAGDIGNRAEVCAVYDDGTIRYGGTADYASPEILIDWKTTTKPRKVYGKEVAQVAAYQKAFSAGATYVANVYISQTTGMIERVVQYTEEQLNHAWNMFVMCYSMDRINRYLESIVNPKKKEDA